MANLRGDKQDSYPHMPNPDINYLVHWLRRLRGQAFAKIIVSYRQAESIQIWKRITCGVKLWCVLRMYR